MPDIRCRNPRLSPRLGRVYWIHWKKDKNMLNYVQLCHSCIVKLGRGISTCTSCHITKDRKIFTLNLFGWNEDCLTDQLIHICFLFQVDRISLSRHDEVCVPETLTQYIRNLGVNFKTYLNLLQTGLSLQPFI